MESHGGRNSDFSDPSWNAQNEKRHSLFHAAWRRLAGAKYDQLVSSADAALLLLNDPDPNVRTAAFSACGDIWRCQTHSAYVAACLKHSLDDPVEQSRVAAIASLGFSFSATKDAFVLKFLARLVLDQGNSDYVRNTAYMTISHVEIGPSLELALWNIDGVVGLLDISWKRVHEFAGTREQSNVEE
jgi:HEAT repeats